MQERSMGEMVRDQRPLTMGPDATVQAACLAYSPAAMRCISFPMGAIAQKSAWPRP
jgi:hypothetical protein